MTSPCCHHWVIETAEGPACKGRCKFCHAERIFTNYMPPVNTIKDHIMLHRAQRERWGYTEGLTRYLRAKPTI